jgi:predicted enzyme related to lactoylglutathione lyase
LSTPDPEGAAAFYEALLGWQVGTDQVFRLADRATAGLVGAPGQPSAWLTYVSTDDADATAAEAVAAGGGVLVPVFDCPPGGRAAVLRDPVGAVFGVWQRASFAGAQVTGEPGTICWVDLATGDAAGAESFYGRVFGWRAKVSGYTAGSEEGAPAYLEFSHDDRAVAGVRELPAELAAVVPPHWLVTFDLDGHADAMERCLSRGAQVLYEPTDVGVGTYAQLLDPYGAAFGLIELDPELRLP